MTLAGRGRRRRWSSALAAVGAVLPPAASSQTDVGAGKALRFGPGGDELRVARVAALEPEEMTVELWAKLDRGQGEHAQFVRKLASWERPGWLFASSQSGYPCVQFRWRDEPAFRTLPDSILETWYVGQWHHYALAYSRKRVTLYIDGVEVSRHDFDGDTPLRHDPEAPLRVGPEGFAGEIDELRVWSRPLGATELKGAMYHSLTGTEKGLVAYWRFDDPKARDLSPNHWTFEGDPDLSARLVDSGAPVNGPARVSAHRAGLAKIARGRDEVERVARTLPPLNGAIYRFATSLAGEPFGGGDCWNFVNQAMSFAGARGRDVYVFGDRVPLEKALPGDLVQFEKFSSPTFGSEHHSAILWRNNGDGTIRVIHQNAPPNGKNVGIWDIDLRTSSGTVTFFRPKS